MPHHDYPRLLVEVKDFREKTPRDARFEQSPQPLDLRSRMLNSTSLRDSVRIETFDHCRKLDDEIAILNFEDSAVHPLIEKTQLQSPCPGLFNCRWMDR